MSLQSSLETEPQCIYCCETETLNLVKCSSCETWFCNANIPFKGSHIVIHLKLTAHCEVSLHPSNPSSSKSLSCRAPDCGNQNVFGLGYIDDDLNQVICRGKCYDSIRGLEASREVEIRLKSLINEERQFRNEIVPMTQSEVSWSEVVRKEGELKPFLRKPLRRLPTSYQGDIELYLDLFEKIIKALIIIEKAKAKSANLYDAQIDWINDFYGSFIVPGNLWKPYKPYFNVRDMNDWQAKAVFKHISDGKVFFALLQRKHQPLDSESVFNIEVEPNIDIYKRYLKVLNKLPELSPDLLGFILGVASPEPDICRRYESIYQQLLNRIGWGQPLNRTQAKAIAKAITQTFTLIQGPPGTGKTTVATEIVKLKLEELRSNDPTSQILVCAPSNNATAHIATKLSEKGLKVIWLVSKMKAATATDCKLTIDEAINASTDFSNLKALRDKKVHRSLTAEEQKVYENLYKLAEQMVLREADVICCTCSCAPDNRLNSFTFEFVLIDEATQSVEPETLCALMRGAKQVVLIGDQKQLGPTEAENELKSTGYYTSMFERLLKNPLGKALITLKMQYRNPRPIADLISKTFYEGKLESAVSDDPNPVENLWLRPDFPALFCEIFEREESCGSSYENRVEYVAIEYFLRNLKNRRIASRDVCVITFYDGQVQVIKRKLKILGAEVDKWFSEVEVSTVDAFQGREMKYVILSCVRSNRSFGVGFVSDERRVNVALSRVQKGLIVIGNSRTLNEQSKLWKTIIECFTRAGIIKPFEDYKNTIARIIETRALDTASDLTRIDTGGISQPRTWTRRRSPAPTFPELGRSRGW